MRKIKYLVVHCTASPQATSVDSIKRYWKNVMGWEDPGYHVIVKPDGEATVLAPIERVTNGVKGYNSKSIHISYIGGVDKNGKPIDNRTTEQKETLLHYLRKWKQMFPEAVILGHRDFSPDKNGNGRVDPWERIKECPCFDAKIEYASQGFNAITEYQNI
ncbi:hypothetical protein DYBT9623_04427 [Dyadobacter sp. CECT 9623]|uniref:N-acetylmuramoyl-L-alanine amidase domain-containing protein n=1 Tax=Dyadobacter linearis TaxID=2823330 RepID=A0ABM8UVR3_9BACT|nr:N-acetylmuramoyl-L-alanine amidase [Dyadobacter sp. CECT 9623]CAG5072888.1 hypothetical protein DYBT9623_04427 [Dyadobacter sp. CECT 9623]